MMHLIGTISSSGGAKTSFESIASVVGNGTSGIINFSSIPSTYQDLELHITQFNNNGFLGLYINDASAASDYNAAIMFATGNGYGQLIQTRSSIIASGYNGDDTTQTFPTSIVFRFPQYANPNTTKNVDGFIGLATSTAGGSAVSYNSTRRLSINVINQISLTTSGSLNSNTVAALYGIKG